jgi:hypothetical protein
LALEEETTGFVSEVLRASRQRKVYLQAGVAMVTLKLLRGRHDVIFDKSGQYKILSEDECVGVGVGKGDVGGESHRQQEYAKHRQR